MNAISRKKVFFYNVLSFVHLTVQTKKTYLRWSCSKSLTGLFTCYNGQIHFSVVIFVSRYIDSTPVRPRILFCQVSEGHSENCCCCVVIQRESSRINPFIFLFSLDEFRACCFLLSFTKILIFCIFSMFVLICACDVDFTS